MMLTALLINQQVLSFNKDILPIFKERCANCHNEAWPDKNWLDYAKAFEYKDKIKDKVYITKLMPIGQDMPDAERKDVADWVDAGAKK